MLTLRHSKKILHWTLHYGKNTFIKVCTVKIIYLSETVKLSFEINSLGSFILTYSFENSSMPNSSFSISFHGKDTSFTVLYPKYFKVATTALS